MDGGEGLEAGPRDQARRALSVLGVAAVAAVAIFAGDVFGVRESILGSATPAPRAVAVSPFVTVNGHGGHPIKSVLRSQPWWQGVQDLSGATTTGTSTTFNIGASVSQWRAKWTCQTGRLVVTRSGQSRPLLDVGCPGTGTAYVTRTGAVNLRVSAGGPWTLHVAQEVDVPLVEPPLPAMSAPGSAIVSTGKFYGIDQKSIGRLVVYRLASGRYALRLSDFYVSPNVDLQVRLDPLRAPHSTHQFLSTKSALAAPLNVTAGSLNFLVPPGLDPTKFRSVVIWCPLIVSAYAAASLTATR
ncbi:MAG: hypothetical protein M3065_09560 [Actinomycetota bacterium]|nr:hypothetical protein [Actinomycetota bacterium]